MGNLFVAEPQIKDSFDVHDKIVVHTGDSREFLLGVPNESISLVVTSPPYNIGKSYETRTSIEEYLTAQSAVISELVRVLRVEGSICWQVGNYVEDSEVFPLDIFYYRIFKDFGLKLRNRMIWHFEHGLHASKRFSGRYETLLWFTKSDNYVFNLDSVRVPAKYPGKTNFKGPNKGKYSGNPLGKNPSDLWRFLEEDWASGVWNIPNVKANHPEKTNHPCQFPVELVERCVLALTLSGDWVLDPYCGAGSALLAAIMHERKAAGIDREPVYTEITKQRIHRLFEGTLKTRPMGKPVHQPSGREKVSQFPLEWTSLNASKDHSQ